MNTIAMTMFLLMCSSLVYGAGFDCSKASTKVEKLICSDEKASYLDSQLNERYKEKIIRLSEDEADFLRLDQTKWISIIRSKCDDVSCIADVYQNRIHEIAKIEKPSINYIHKACLGKFYDECDIELYNKVDDYIKKIQGKIANSYYDESDQNYMAELDRRAEDAQSAWEKYRHHHCDGVVGGVTKGGSGYGHFILQCKMLLSKQRLEVLLGNDYGG